MPTGTGIVPYLDPHVAPIRLVGPWKDQESRHISVGETAGEGSGVPVYALGEHVPDIHPNAWVHPDAVVIGRVTIGSLSTIWPTAVLRADHHEIRIGERTSIQDGTVVHCTSDLPTLIGSRCVVGHRAHLEGCTVEDDCLIGSGSVLLARVVVRTGALVGAGAVVSPGTEVPARAMALGVPARVRRDAVEPGAFDQAVARYVASGPLYRDGLRRLG